MSDLSQLIDRVRGGEREAYGTVVARFQDMAIGYAQALLGDAHQAEDAAQEAFLRAYVDLGQLRDAAAFPGWFRRIVQTQCRRISRQRQSHGLPLDADPPETGPGPAATLEAHDRREMLERAIQRLPETERAAVGLYYLRQYSQAEVAAFLELPVTTVNNRMHSARTHLKQELLDMAEQERNGVPAPDQAFAGRVQEQVEALTQVHEALTEPISAALAESLAGEVAVRVVSVDHRVGLKVLQELECPCCMYTFEPQDGERRICFNVDMELAACIVGRTVGRGDDIRLVEVRVIGGDEWERIHPVALRMMKQVVGAWSDVEPMEVINAEVETSPVCMMDSVIAADDPVFRVRFEVAWDGRTCDIDLCYPAPSLTAALERLQSRAAARRA